MGSNVNIAVHQNHTEEQKQESEFWLLQEDILLEYGQSSPSNGHPSSLPQQSCTLSISTETASVSPPSPQQWPTHWQNTLTWKSTSNTPSSSFYVQQQAPSLRTSFVYAHTPCQTLLEYRCVSAMSKTQYYWRTRNSRCEKWVQNGVTTSRLILHISYALPLRLLPLVRSRWKCQRGTWCCLSTSLAIKHPCCPTSLDPRVPFRKTVKSPSQSC